MVSSTNIYLVVVALLVLVLPRRLGKVGANNIGLVGRELLTNSLFKGNDYRPETCLIDSLVY